MPTYLNAFIMLLATLTIFVALAKLAQYARTGRLRPSWKGRDRTIDPATGTLVRVEQSCVIDGKRRLVSVRCGTDRIFILTGGPADLVVSQRPLESAQGEQA